MWIKEHREVVQHRACLDHIDSVWGFCLQDDVICGYCGAGFFCHDCTGLTVCYCGDERVWLPLASDWFSVHGYCTCDDE